MPTDSTEWTYIFQAALIGGTLFYLARRQPFLLQIQILAWTIGVIAIALRFGISEQLVFYSNDQMVYAKMLVSLRDSTAESDLTWWISGAKLPFTGAALPLAWAGIYVPLALKTVSLVSLLVLSKSLLERNSSVGIARQASTAYLTGCGTIGVFFSLLALRETMLMLFAYQFVTANKLSSRTWLLVALALLRPHLALVLLLGELLLSLWDSIRTPTIPKFLEPVALIFLGMSAGKLAYNWRLQDLGRSSVSFVDSWSLNDAIRVASNFVGLQFLTNDVWNVRLSIQSLLLLRLVLSETVLIPALFTILILMKGHRLTRLHRLALVGFTMYVSIATNTDFNSFRQNIPFMPILGVVVLELLRARSQRFATPRSERAEPTCDVAESEASASEPRGT